MKNRDEFLQSVYAKEKAVKAQRKIYKKRMITSLTAAAACLVLMVGMGRIAMADLMMGGEMENVDSAATGGDIGFYAGSDPGSDSAPSQDGSDGAQSEDGSDSAPSQDGSDSAPSGDESNASGGENRKNSESAKLYQKGARPGTSSISGYYCMPVAVVVEDADGNGIRYEGFSDMDQAIKWVRELTRDGKAFGDKELSAKKKGDYVYKVTLVYSSEDDPDSAGSDQIYYIFEEVAYFE